MVPAELLNGAPDIILSIVAAVFPECRVDSVRVLGGGKTNLNVLFQLEGFNDRFVLRRYRRGSEACRKEQRILNALRGKLPVPELIASFISDEEGRLPYMVYRYVPGQTFREIRQAGSAKDMAEAAYAIGDCLSILDKCDLSHLRDDELRHRYANTLSEMDSPLLQERLYQGDWPLLEALLKRHWMVLQELFHHQGLSHGDFNHRNVVLVKTADEWKVAAILDWELAGMGSVLWDVARFTCYEKQDSSIWEEAFLRGALSSLERIPGNRKEFLLALNVLSAARSLSDPAAQSIFVPDLRELVHAGLRGERIG